MEEQANGGAEAGRGRAATRRRGRQTARGGRSDQARAAARACSARGDAGGGARAASRNAEQKHHLAREVQSDLDARVGRDVTRRLVDVPPPDPEEIAELSALFNQALCKHFVPNYTGGHNFFQLFKAIDADGSRRLSFSELEEMARIALHLTQKDLPDRYTVRREKGPASLAHALCLLTDTPLLPSLLALSTGSSSNYGRC